MQQCAAYPRPTRTLTATSPPNTHRAHMTTSPFVVLHGSRKLNLEATAEGFSLFKDSEPLRVEWRDVRSMTRPDLMSVKFEFSQHPVVQFAFQSVADRNRFLTLA